MEVREGLAKFIYERSEKDYERVEKGYERSEKVKVKRAMIIGKVEGFQVKAIGKIYRIAKSLLREGLRKG